jgi:formyltetrahydrofolate synthetase
MIFLLLAAAGTSAPLMQTDYGRCLERRAGELEPSGERPNDVANAAIQLCSQEGQDYARNRNVSIELMDRINALAKNMIAGRIVEIRACHKTRACQDGKLPEK